MPRRAGALAAVAGVTLGIVVFGHAPPAGACSCVLTQTDAIAEADAVFTGSVVERDGGSDRYARHHLFSVDAVFKGQVHERQWVDTGADVTTCKANFEPQVSYLVVAMGGGSADAEQPGGELQTEVCLHSTALELGLPQGLGTPTDPLPGTSPAAGGGTPSWRIAAILGGAVAATAVVVRFSARQLAGRRAR